MRRPTLCSLIVLLCLPAAATAATTAATVAPATDGSRCTCMSPKRPTCEVWWQTSAIFIGRVTRVETITEEDEGGIRVKRLVDMRVQERWRGLQGQRDVVIATGAGGGDCGFRFEANRTYLVYANQSTETGRYETGICSRTAAIEEAEADIAYLRSLATVPQTVSLYGMVYRERQQLPAGQPADAEMRLDPGGPLSGVEITLAGGGAERTVTSDADGWYELSDLPTGRYELRLSGERIDPGTRWRLRIPTAPACIWRNVIVDPLPIER